MTAKLNNSVKIGDFAKVQKAAAKLQEVYAMLQDIKTTCGNIDSAMVHLGFASDEIENYTNWAIKQYKALDEAIKEVNESVPSFPCDGCGQPFPLDEMKDGTKGKGVFGMCLCPECMEKEDLGVD